MDKLLITGGTRLNGEVRISGAKKLGIAFVGRNDFGLNTDDFD